MKKVFINLLIFSILSYLPVFAFDSSTQIEDTFDLYGGRATEDSLDKKSVSDKDLKEHKKNKKPAKGGSASGGKKGKKKITIPPKEVDPETEETFEDDVILELDNQ